MASVLARVVHDMSSSNFKTVLNPKLQDSTIKTVD